MKPPAVDLMEFFETMVRPHLTVENAYADVKFSSKSGRYWRGGCVHHDGKDPNFSVDTQTLGYS